MTIKEIQAKVIESAKKYDPQEEFGISLEYNNKLISLTNDYFKLAINNMPMMDLDFTNFDVSDGDIEEEEQYINPLQRDDYTTIYEQHGWTYTRQALSNIPALEGEYLFHFEVKKERLSNIAFCNVILGLALDMNQGKKLTLGCNCTESKDDQNHFWLLKTTK